MRANETSVTTRFVEVGRIIKSHGLSGEVLVALAVRTSFHELVGAEVWITPPTDSLHHTSFEAITPASDGQNFRVRFVGVSSLNDSSGLSRRRLICAKDTLSRDALDEIEQESRPQHYLGYRVDSTNYGPLGEVVEYLETKANDCLVVKGAYGEVILPIIDDVMLEVDEEARMMSVFVLPGLIDEGRRES